MFPVSFFNVNTKTLKVTQVVHTCGLYYISIKHHWIDNMWEKRDFKI